MARRAPAAVLVLLLVAVASLDAARPGATRAPVGAAGAKVAAPPPRGQRRAAPQCLWRPGPDVCALNPAWAFADAAAQSGAGAAQPLEDRLFRRITAQQALCPHHGSRSACAGEAGAACAWNGRLGRCEADRYASWLLPLTCAGSEARALLSCMPKPTAECRADPACTDEHDATCLPRTLLAKARAANATVHGAVERVALGVLKGDKAVVGGCVEGKLLGRVAKLCPHSASWGRCSSKFCTFEVPPYLPQRPAAAAPAAQQQPGAGGVASAYMRPPTATPGGLSYYGEHPAPLCGVDTERLRLPAQLAAVLGVSAGLARRAAAADAACRAQDSITFDAVTHTAACGTATISYDPTASSNCGAARSARGSSSSSPARGAARACWRPAAAGAVGRGERTRRSASSTAARAQRSQQLVPGVGAPAPLTMDALARAAAQDKSQAPSSSDKAFAYRVAYQGVAGAYSEMAARQACPDAEPVPCEQFEVAFQALSQWTTDWAVLPIENSLGGSIHAVYDLLLRYRLHIVGETSVAVNHCLLALPGTKPSDLTRVLSHPQALAQTDTYLRRLGVVREAVDDTAGAARMVAAEKLQGVGAVASRRAAELYGLDILDEDIQDAKDNVTRFIKLARDPLLSREGEGEARAFKTSIVFSLKEGPGQLFKALSVFALRDIDMTKIESRPMRSNPILPAEGGGGGGRARFNYLFYIDFVGALSDPVAQNALRHLQESAPFMRVLGSYPMELELGRLDSNTPFDSITEAITSQQQQGVEGGTRKGSTRAAADASAMGSDLPDVEALERELKAIRQQRNQAKERLDAMRGGRGRGRAGAGPGRGPGGVLSRLGGAPGPRPDAPRGAGPGGPLGRAGRRLSSRVVVPHGDGERAGSARDSDGAAAGGGGRKRLLSAVVVDGQARTASASLDGDGAAPDGAAPERGGDEPAAKRPAVAVDDKTVKRAKRMFGALVGTLQRFQSEDAAFRTSAKAQSRAELQRRAEEKEAAERAALEAAEAARREADAAARRGEREDQLRRLMELTLKSDVKALEILYARRIARRSKLLPFCVTRAQPPLYWAPRAPCDESAALRQAHADSFEAWRQEQLTALEAEKAELAQRAVARRERASGAGPAGAEQPHAAPEYGDGGEGGGSEPGAPDGEADEGAAGGAEQQQEEGAGGVSEGEPEPEPRPRRTRRRPVGSDEEEEERLLSSEEEDEA
ncbi:ADT2 [Scenedesmus sp. PABB004]|nr:ADT2 [Scenedesmus sp. PABB004]